MTLDADYKWGSCSKNLSWDAGRYRHIVRRGGLDTLCGHSASFPEIWRDHKRKPNCDVCVEQAKVHHILS